MNPLAIAARWHSQSGCGIPFHELIEAHAATGAVWFTPRCFLLARRIDPDWPPERILDPWQADPAGCCWHVWLLAGDVSEALTLPSAGVPWISWHRGNRFVKFPAAKWRRFFLRGHLVGNGKQSAETAPAAGTSSAAAARAADG